MWGRFLDRLLRVKRGSHLDPGREPVTNPGNEGWVIGNPETRHPYAIGPDHSAARFIGGMEFCATFQVRTPLRILGRHGQVLPLGAALPDDFEPWMGIWVPKPKSAGQRPYEGEIASPAGPVTAAVYLPFLIAVREAVEDAVGGIAGRMARLQAVCALPQFARFVAAERRARISICDRFFPPVLSLIPGLSGDSQAELRQLRLFTVGALRGATDDVLLAVKGVGPSKLKAIREFCGIYAGDPEAERIVDLAE
jgi:hypothetical protein